MTGVFVADLFSLRRLVVAAVTSVVALVVALSVGETAVPPTAWPTAVALTTAASTWLLLVGYYRADRWRDYVHLPVSPVRMLSAFTAATWLLWTVEILAPLTTIGLVVGGMDWRTFLGCVSLQGALVAAMIAIRTWAGRRGTAAATALALVLAVSTAAVLVRLPWWAVPTWAAVVGAGAWAWFTTRPGYHLFRPRSIGGRPPTGNYFLAVLTADRTILLNGSALLVVAVFLTVTGAQAGLTYPLGFAIVAVSSPVAGLLSTDPGTLRQFRMLGRPRALVRQYAVCAACYFGAVNAVVLAGCAAVGASTLPRLALLAVSATVLETVLVPLLEARWPVTRWKTVREVWRHPRKYLVAVLVLVMTTVVVGS